MEVCSPMSLFEACVRYVAGNLDMVESLCGFPAQIGEKIFVVAINSDKWQCERGYEVQGLQLCTEAFQEDVLSSLNISGRYLGLNYSLELILMFEHLKELDVSHCGLGDDHEILLHTQHLTCLEVLCLSYNVITNAGIRKISNPYRMFHKGPANLVKVNVSGNLGIDAACCKSLSAFPRLQRVVYSDSRSTKDMSKLLPDWLLEEENVDQREIKTTGWASSLIDRWISTAERKSRQKTVKPTMTKFYSSNKLRKIGDMSNSSNIQDNRKRILAIRKPRQFIQTKENLRLTNTDNGMDFDDGESIMDIYRSMQMDNKTMDNTLPDKRDKTGNSNPANNTLNVLDDFDDNNDTFGGNNGTFDENNDTFGGNNGTFDENNDTFGGNNGTFDENNDTFDGNNGNSDENNDTFDGNNGTFDENNEEQAAENNEVTSNTVNKFKDCGKIVKPRKHSDIRIPALRKTTYCDNVKPLQTKRQGAKYRTIDYLAKFRNSDNTNDTPNDSMCSLKDGPSDFIYTHGQCLSSEVSGARGKRIELLKAFSRNLSDQDNTISSDKSAEQNSMCPPPKGRRVRLVKRKFEPDDQCGKQTDGEIGRFDSGKVQKLDKTIPHQNTKMSKHFCALSQYY